MPEEIWRSSQLSVRSGMTLIELLVAIALIVIIFGGAYLSYSSILETLTNSELRTGAVSLLNREIEVVRNIPYDSVGTLGGIPPGILERQKTAAVGAMEFLVVTIVRNVDDPFDGTLGGVPNDTAPADYKLVEVEVSCLRCERFVPIAMTTTIAPANLEATGSSGSLFIHAIDANGEPLSEAAVHVVNDTVSPTIDLMDTTNVNGMLQLVGVPPATQSYQITVSKPGYSTDRTYPLGGAGNPNPVKPHATVAVGQLTDITFAIDALSTLGLSAVTRTCFPQPGVAATLTGSKIIGTAPDVPKIVTSTTTGPDGRATVSGLEWDGYTLGFSTTTAVLVGASPPAPLAVDPGTSPQLTVTYAPPAPKALAVRVRDAANGDGIANAAVALGGETRETGSDLLRATDWSGGVYASKSDQLDADGLPGSLRVAQGPGGYATSAQWLVSATIDTGSTSTEYLTLVWNPGTQPQSTSARLQVASNDDSASWTFVGPDGTPGTWYTESGTALGNAHQHHRYLRYRVDLSTTDSAATPRVDEVRIGYRGPCLPPDTAYFELLTGGSQAYTVTASGYAMATGTATTSAAWQEVTVPLTHL